MDRVRSWEAGSTPGLMMDSWMGVPLRQDIQSEIHGGEDAVSMIRMPAGARIASYDTLLSAPRIIEIPALPIRDFIAQITTKTYELSHALGGDIPYTVIQEVAENYIHADFMEPVISILDKGNTITFADQGPGIQYKDKAQIPGFTSATHAMKHYIRGVGSGLPIVKEYLTTSGGQLKIEDNLENGTVVTISLVEEYRETGPESPIAASRQPSFAKPRFSSQQQRISERENLIMGLFHQYEEIGQTDIKNLLGISAGTATRTLELLEKRGWITSNSSRKRVLTREGYDYLHRKDSI